MQFKMKIHKHAAQLRDPHLSQPPNTPSMSLGIRDQAESLSKCHWDCSGSPSTFPLDGDKERAGFGVHVELLRSVLQQSTAHPRGSSCLRHPSKLRHLLGNGSISSLDLELFMELSGPDEW